MDRGRRHGLRKLPDVVGHLADSRQPRLDHWRIAALAAAHPNFRPEVKVAGIRHQHVRQRQQFVIPKLAAGAAADLLQQHQRLVQRQRADRIAQQQGVRFVRQGAQGRAIPAGQFVQRPRRHRLGVGRHRIRHRCPRMSSPCWQNAPARSLRYRWRADRAVWLRPASCRCRRTGRGWSDLLALQSASDTRAPGAGERRAQTDTSHVRRGLASSRLTVILDRVVFTGAGIENRFNCFMQPRGMLYNTTSGH
jgi:hypothetical protein